MPKSQSWDTAAALSPTFQLQRHELVIRLRVSICTCSSVGTSLQGPEGTLALALWVCPEDTASEFPKMEWHRCLLKEIE